MHLAIRATALLATGLLAGLATIAVAAEPGAAPAAALTPAPAATRAPAPPRVTMQELMRGIYFPAANVLFSAQDDVTKMPPADDPTISPNPLTSVYGGWLAVESAALALLDSRELLDRPGRLCSNKRLVPVRSPQWQAFSRLMTDAAVAAYRAARSKNVDRMVDVSGTLTDACDACHKVFRDQDVPGKPAGTKDVCPAS